MENSDHQLVTAKEFDHQGWYFHLLLLSKRKGKESKKLSFPEKKES
jgi:hypothetical protein